MFSSLLALCPVSASTQALIMPLLLQPAVRPTARTAGTWQKCLWWQIWLCYASQLASFLLPYPAAFFLSKLYIAIARSTRSVSVFSARSFVTCAFGSWSILYGTPSMINLRVNLIPITITSPATMVWIMVVQSYFSFFITPVRFVYERFWACFSCFLTSPSSRSRSLITFRFSFIQLQIGAVASFISFAFLRFRRISRKVNPWQI